MAIDLIILILFHFLNLILIFISQFLKEFLKNLYNLSASHYQLKDFLYSSLFKMEDQRKLKFLS